MNFYVISALFKCFSLIFTVLFYRFVPVTDLTSTFVLLTFFLCDCLMGIASRFGLSFNVIISGHVTALSPADGFSQLLHFTSHFSTFSTDFLNVPVTFSVDQYVGENDVISPSDMKYVLYHLFDVSIHQRHRFINLSF